MIKEDRRPLRDRRLVELGSGTTSGERDGRGAAEGDEIEGALWCVVDRDRAL